ncbi:hypothetical protein B0F90DRAFT_706843 [Multifurca ochricompacta]|uniref:Secreted protein n=1 Tax=Multifurca ochricompacta TaxID=376703 RepID=A0AAD4LTP0_9AGAM|nr:hypothetical protein B0F90DRAFT_706843 [Multifurca ochricompacta]
MSAFSWAMIMLVSWLRANHKTPHTDFRVLLDGPFLSAMTFFHHFRSDLIFPYHGAYSVACAPLSTGSSLGGGACASHLID